MSPGIACGVEKRKHRGTSPEHIASILIQHSSKNIVYVLFGCVTESKAQTHVNEMLNCNVRDATRLQAWLAAVQ